MASSVSQAQYEPAPQSFYLEHQDVVSAVTFSENSTSKLSGSWLFYPSQFLTEPSSVLQGKTVQLPASFKTLMGSNVGYGTFIAHFKIPEEFIGRRVAIHIPNQYGAYRVYLNGDFLVRLGEISTQPAGQVTEKAPRTAYFVPQHAYFTLSIQASNYTHLHGGFEKPMRIGLASTINRQFQQLMMSITAVCGAVLGVGVFTVLFAVFRGPRNHYSRSMLVFGVFIIFLALHNIFSAPYAYSVFTKINWLWGTRFEYLFTFATILLFLTYMYLNSPRYLNRYIYWVAVFLLSLNIVMTLLTQPEFFERFALYSASYSVLVIGNFIYGFMQVLKHKEVYSKANLFTVIFLCLTFLNDYLLLINVIDSIHLSFISTSLYALLIMFQQSKHYASQTYQTEQLNQELLALNSSLDEKVQQRTRQLNELNEKLEYQINIDALTGAFNRRALNAEIWRKFNALKQTPEQSLVFVMIDVDFFKNYNDFYGHLKGDDILQNLVETIQNALPEHAYVARYGGEEFALLLQGIPDEAMAYVLEKVLQAIRDKNFEHLNRPDGKQYVTVSMGVACMNKKIHYANIHDMMKDADNKLYEAKQAGRDQLKMSGIHSTQQI